MDEALQQIIRWIYPLASIVLISVVLTRRNLPGKAWFMAFLVIGLVTMLAWRLPRVLGQLEIHGFDISRFFDLFALPINILSLVGFCMLFPFVFAVSSSSLSRTIYDSNGTGVKEQPSFTATSDGDSLEIQDGTATTNTKNSLFSFDGRIKRSTFWAVIAPLMLISFVLQIAMVASEGSEGAIGIAVIALILLIPAIWLSLATYVKRWHDLNVSGWMVLTLFIPLVNVLILLYLGIAPGTEGANRFGEEPR